MRLSVQLQLRPTKDQGNALKETLKVANKAANSASRTAFGKGVFGQFKLHKLVYSGLRSEFGLPSQLAVRVIAKVADAYKIKRHKQRSFKPLGSVAFDSRNYSLLKDKDIVSISTLNGREKINFTCGQRQLDLLEFEYGEADLVYLKRKWYLYVTVSVDEPPQEIVDDVLGIDLGIVNIAADSHGQTFSGGKVTETRKRYSGLRQRLQKCGTPSAKRHLKKLSGKEKNFVKTVNHTISKRIVEKAKRHCAAIALEDLKGIRQATVRKAQRFLHNSWSFYQLRQFVEYKAALAGIPVVLVDPRYTSQTCPACDHIAKGNRPTRDDFRCQDCGFAGPSDTISALNISARASVNAPIVGISV